MFQTAQHRSEIITEKRFLELEGQYIKNKEAMPKEALLEFKKYVEEEVLDTSDAYYKLYKVKKAQQ